MQPPPWTSIALLVGLVLMLAGPLAVSLLLPTSAVWTNEDADKLSQASANLHAAIHAHGGHDHGPAHPAGASESSLPALAAAQREYDAQQSRLEASRSRQGWLESGARLLGVVIAACGIAGYIMARRGGA
ncbi:MAG: hypothetical protein L0211_03030 [Planctomycetaceae bacterium]|nr:hypothetical protein [Planctomycetaceae bacterium]